MRCEQFKSRLAILLLAAAGCGLSACSTAVEAPVGMVPETRYVVVDRAAEIPPGVLRYCWEEPLVQFERNGPGLDAEGEWYHPFYVAAREVRQGRWRPCGPVESEVRGDMRNER